MAVKDDYLAYKNAEGLNPSRFEHRVRLQQFLKNRLEDLWRECFSFSHGGLFSNYMTGFAIGFAYYDCRPTSFCKERCYGLPLSGGYDYNMLRLGVMTSESLKQSDPRYLVPLRRQIERLKVPCLKIGHWGEATVEQVPVLLQLARQTPDVTFWWYTRKIEIARAVNEATVSNIKSYLSLDPDTPYPTIQEYPFGLTYLFGDGKHHCCEEGMLKDRRLVAIFALKRGRGVEDPGDLINHKQMCPEKTHLLTGNRAAGICLTCSGRCHYESGGNKTVCGGVEVL